MYTAGNPTASARRAGERIDATGGDDEVVAGRGARGVGRDRRRDQASAEQEGLPVGDGGWQPSVDGRPFTMTPAADRRTAGRRASPTTVGRPATSGPCPRRSPDGRGRHRDSPTTPATSRHGRSPSLDGPGRIGSQPIDHDRARHGLGHRRERPSIRPADRARILPPSYGRRDRLVPCWWTNGMAAFGSQSLTLTPADRPWRRRTRRRGRRGSGRSSSRRWRTPNMKTRAGSTSGRFFMSVTNAWR